MLGECVLCHHPILDGEMVVQTTKGLAHVRCGFPPPKSILQELASMALAAPGPIARWVEEQAREELARQREQALKGKGNR